MNKISLNNGWGEGSGFPGAELAGNVAFLVDLSP